MMKDRVGKANQNHLHNATSPYLKQHAHNPVAWHSWNADALAIARAENKPILLSIGYSACHWCHVMAHESFENADIAKLMNDYFINIKVDREERPDLDKIYQTAHWLLTRQSGGWPLTIFLTPDELIPFFSGTYFPPEPRFNLPSFKEVLIAIHRAYHEKTTEIKQQNAELKLILQSMHKQKNSTHLSMQPWDTALDALSQRYDKKHGGFSMAPKFPQPTLLNFLTENQSPMAIETLQHIARGGLYDHLQGGFYRYSVDAEWIIPHFEKMLYDNGQLLFTYTEAAKRYQTAQFDDVIKNTAYWVLEKMQSPEGGYYSSLDADSENKEGKFYVWDKEEIKELLSDEEYESISLYFGLDKRPNFEEQWHLYNAQTIEQLAELSQRSPAHLSSLLLSAKQKLIARRNQRALPHLDTKVLTAWNGLMIKGMLVAGDYLQEQPVMSSAENALNFMQQYVWHNNRLLASYYENTAHLTAYLDDYAFLIDALLTALQIQWNIKYLTLAINLADALLTYFYDQEEGGFFFTAHDHETLLYRPKVFMDEAIPSGNGIAVKVLLVLGHLLGESRYINAAEKTLQTAWPIVTEHPSEHCSMLLGLKEFLKPSAIIIIRGDAKEIKQWQTQCRNKNNLVFAIPANEQDLPYNLALRKFTGTTSAYVCKGTQCSNVIHSMAELKTIHEDSHN